MSSPAPQSESNKRAQEQSSKSSSEAGYVREPRMRRENRHAVTPYLTVHQPAELIDFVTQAFGAIEHFIGTRLRQCPKVGAGTCRGFLEGGLHAGMQFRELGQHADRLRTLAREDQGELCGGSGHTRSGLERPQNQGTRMIRAIALARLYRGVLGFLRLRL